MVDILVNALANISSFKRGIFFQSSKIALPSTAYTLWGQQWFWLTPLSSNLNLFSAPIFSPVDCIDY